MSREELSNLSQWLIRKSPQTFRTTEQPRRKPRWSRKVNEPCLKFCANCSIRLRTIRRRRVTTQVSSYTPGVDKSMYIFAKKMKQLTPKGTPKRSESCDCSVELSSGRLTWCGTGHFSEVRKYWAVGSVTYWGRWWWYAHEIDETLSSLFFLEHSNPWPELQILVEDVEDGGWSPNRRSNRPTASVYSQVLARKD